MIARKIEKKLECLLNDNYRKALLITGARQIGKTFSISSFGKSNFKHFIEINLLNDKKMLDLFRLSHSASDLLMRLSSVYSDLIPGETLIFIDEIQEYPDIVTLVKFLVEDGRYKYVLSGSLLGVELKDIRSYPVGYMDFCEMYPLDFEEFAIANGVSTKTISDLKLCFEQQKPVDEFIHDRISELFRLYLIVGGMPEAVDMFLKTSNLSRVAEIQDAIIKLYKKDISKYDPENKLYLNEIFNLIPSELNCKNKRFILKKLNENLKFARYENSFLWLSNAGVALPTYCVNEPVVPLLLSKSTNLFKLFLSDVGLLASMYMGGIQIKVLNREKDINFGSIYENFVAQELKAHNFNLYYFNSKKQGELDFVIERDGRILPIEVKSGKAYAKHAALNNVLGNAQYGISEAFVLYDGNIMIKEKVVYYPVYMAMFLENKKLPQDLIYAFNPAGL